MKFPCARFGGDRGTLRETMMSYGCWETSEESRDAMPYGFGPSLPDHDIRSSPSRSRNIIPVLQMDDSFNPNLRDVVEIEENVCKHRKS